MTEDGKSHGDEFLANEHRVFVRRVHNILEQAQTFCTEADGTIKVAGFDGTKEFETVTIMQASKEVLSINDDLAKHNFVYASEWLAFPIYSFEHGLLGAGLRFVTSPYGLMPNFVIAPDGKLYGFSSSSYYFDTQGNAFKSETVVCWTDLLEKDSVSENFYRIIGIAKRAIPEIDFVPDPKKTRVMSLDPGDYEKLDTLLHLIETGAFREIDYTKL